MKSTEDYLRDVLVILFARKKLILGVTLGMFLAALAVTLLWPRTYTVSGSVLVKNRQLSKSPQAIESTQTRVWEVDLATMTTEMRILTSAELLKQTVADLNAAGKLDDEPMDEDALDDFTGQVRGRLSAVVVPASNIIELTLRGRDPKEIKTILESLMERYIAFRSGIYNPGQAPEYYKDEADGFKKNLQDMDKRMVDLAGRVNSADPMSEIQNNLDLRKTLEQQLELLKQDKINLASMVVALTEKLNNKNIQFFSSIDNHAINLLSDKLQEIYLEKTNALRVFTEDSEKVRSINEQINELYAALKAEVQSYLGAQQNRLSILTQQESLLTARIASLTQRNIELHGILVRQQRLKNESQVMEQSYQVFATRSEEARISSSSDLESLFSISILAKPVLPGEPTFPNAKVVLPAGLLAGLLLGLSLGFFAEYFDSTFKTPSDVVRHAGLTTLFSIPDWTVARR